jgi:hypothetical protein
MENYLSFHSMIIKDVRAFGEVLNHSQILMAMEIVMMKHILDHLLRDVLGNNSCISSVQDRVSRRIQRSLVKRRLKGMKIALSGSIISLRSKL